MQDWLGTDFIIAEAFNFDIVSFVKSAEVIKHLKIYIASGSHGRYHGYNYILLFMLCWKSHICIIKLITGVPRTVLDA